MLRSKTHLHEALKRHFAQAGGEVEAKVGSYWVDVLCADRIVEVQTTNLHGLRKKLQALSQHGEVQVVYPIPAAKFVVRRAKRGGEVLSRRRSPKRGRPLDVFQELVNVAGVLPGPNLTLSLLMTEEEDHRVDDGKGSWRRRGVSLVDRVLVNIVEQLDLRTGADYLNLLPALPPSPFTNKQLARASKMPEWLARRATYFLSRGGALEQVNRTQEGIWYSVVTKERSPMAKASGKQRCPHCGEELDTYRNPVPTVDLVIEVKDGIVLVERKNDPKGWALPGGFVDYGESLEAAAIREAKEETGLKVELIRQFHTYSDPHRDPRQHNLSTVFIARARGKPKGGDDAKRAEVFTEGDLPTLVFDHRWILEDYFAYMRRMRPLVERRAK